MSRIGFGRFSLVFAAVLIAATSWAGAFVHITSLNLDPDPSKCAAGDKIHVTGTLQYRYLRGFIPNWGVGGTRVDHWLHIYVDWAEQPGQDWPELPNLKTALGKLLVGYSGPFKDYKPVPGAKSQEVWSHHIGSPMRSSEKDPVMKTETRDFDFVMTVPNAPRFRLRAALDHCYGWNWFVTWYYYDWRVYPGPLAKGMKAITVTCSRKGYFPVSDVVLVPATASDAVISGTVTDRQLAVPLPGATVTAEVASTTSAKDGSYQVTARVGGAGPPAQATCNFSLDSARDAVRITLKATKAGFEPGPKRTIVVRAASGKVVVCGPVRSRQGDLWWTEGGAEVEAAGPGGVKRFRCGPDGWYHIEFVLDASRPGTYKKAVELHLGKRTAPVASKPKPLPGGVTSDGIPNEDAFEKEVAKRMENAPKWGRKALDWLAWWNAVKADWQHRLMGGSDSPNLKKYYKRRKTATGEIRNAIDVISSEGIGKIPNTDKIQQAQEIYKRLSGKKPSGQKRPDLITIIRNRYNQIEAAGK